MTEKTFRSPAGTAIRLSPFLVRSALAAIGMVCAFSASAQRVWGINGHPNENEYLVWKQPEKAREQFNYLDELGVTHYRVSFSESKDDPRILCHLFEPMKGRSKKIEVVPVVFADVVPSAGYQSNYDTGYAQGRKWAEYVLKNDYAVRYWELGNETSLARVNGTPLFVLRPDGDPTNPDHWSDNLAQGMSGATESMAGILRGLYWGIKDAYGPNGVYGYKGATTQILFGDTWMNFGYVRKLMRVGMAEGPGFLPADILSWHWYTPSFNSFTAPGPNGAPSPVAHAKSFGKKIWMTEIGREEKFWRDGQWRPVGGSADNLDNNNQNWMKQSDEMARELGDLLGDSEITGIFAYQLYDETIKFASASQFERSSQAFYGLLNAEKYRKTAFGTYRDYAHAYPGQPAGPAPAITVPRNCDLP